MQSKNTMLLLTKKESYVFDVFKKIFSEIENISGSNTCLKSIFIKIKLRKETINDQLVNDWKLEVLECMRYISRSILYQISIDLFNFRMQYKNLWDEYKKIFIYFYFPTESFDCKNKNWELHEDKSNKFQEYKCFLHAINVMDSFLTYYQNNDFQRWVNDYIDFLINIKIFIESNGE